jgi:hypothetical protein
MSRAQVFFQSSEEVIMESLCLPAGCYQLTAGDNIYPAGINIILGGVLHSGVPMDMQIKVEGGVMLNGCGAGAQPVAEPARDPDVKPYVPAGAGAGGGGGAAGPLQCYRWWRGTEPAKPTTKFSDCGGHMTWCRHTHTYCCICTYKF